MKISNKISKKNQHLKKMIPHPKRQTPTQRINPSLHFTDTHFYAFTSLQRTAKQNAQIANPRYTINTRL
ncbi:hypothetical protein CEV08_08200 [Bartonella tribocorum]|uniref:Uncharacterized protein n=1 Tax=Bartonella tribocorum TaxID=85701 RepID=A0A2M6UQE0_9HYPH|nr:hypothetical protein CEV08_08200 [Bartonella tribocorum]